MNRRHILRLAIVAGALIIVAGAVARRGDRSLRGAATATARADRVVAAPRTPALAAPPAGAAPPAAVPASLAGTEADGAVTADAAGHLVIDVELRRLFDHFLAATGEEPLATLRARIIAALRARLPATAAAEAIDILDRYLGYRDAARRLAGSASAAAGLDQLHDLRANALSPAVATALFGDEEAAIRAALDRREVAADRTLTPAERDRQLAEIDARTPPAVRDARAAALAPVDELARETALRAAGASDAQIAATRVAAFGPAAAAQLAGLDRAHAAWDARLAQFRAARAAVLADPRLDDAERRRQIDELLARSFTAPERIRVDALDRIAAGTAQ